MFLSLPNLLSMLLTMTMIIFLIVAMFAIHDHNKPKNLIVFVMVCVTMAIWAFGAAASISASNLSDAKFWHFIAMIGLMTAFASGLHYVLLIFNEKLIQKKVAVIALIYVPVPIFVVLFGIDFFASMGGNLMIETVAGWVMVEGNRYILLFKIIYNLMFAVLIGLGIIYWYRKKAQTSIRQELNPILLAILLTTLASILLEKLWVSNYETCAPEIGPVIGIIPAAVLLIQVEKHALLNLYQRTKRPNVLRSEAKDLIYKYISKVFIVTGLFAAVFESIVGGKDIFTAIVFGVVIALFGVALKWILISKASNYKKDNYICIGVSLFVPFLMFFALMNGVGTAWPVVFLFLIVFMLYNNSRMILGIAISIFSTLLVIANIVPTNTVQIDAVDHFLRLFITILFTIIAYVVNNIYISKLKENDSQYKNQEIVNKITSLLVKSTYNEFHASFQKALAMIGEHFNVDRVYHFSIDREQLTMTYENGWTNNDDEPQTGSIQNIPITKFKWWINQLEEVGYVDIPLVHGLPQEAKSEELQLNQLNIISTIAMPMISKNELVGFIGLASADKQCYWDQFVMTTLKIISYVLTDATIRYNAEAMIHEMAFKDYLTGLPNRASFFEFLDKALILSKRRKSGLLVGLLDLDGFKEINDMYGHDVGDSLLKEVANRLKEGIRQSDMVCRFGGDEFLILFDDVLDKTSVARLGDEIIQKFERPFMIGNREQMITSSLGLKYCADCDSNVQQIVSQADKAMYNAKKLGKNQFFINEESAYYVSDY